VNRKIEAAMQTIIRRTAGWQKKFFLNGIAKEDSG
jgi:hypothetical protein